MFKALIEMESNILKNTESHNMSMFIIHHYQITRIIIHLEKYKKKIFWTGYNKISLDLRYLQCFSVR